MFTKAVRKDTKLRLALMGPAGSGKTTLALGVASVFGGKVAVIDTEHGRSRLHSDRFAFDVDELEEFSPQRYLQSLQEAAASGYQTVIIDSLSHAWAGRGGLLEQHDLAAKKRRDQNGFAAWGDITPIHHSLIEAMLTWPGHLIATMRVKTDYALEKNEATGKTVPRDIGLAPVQRDGMEYEFDLVGRLDLDHTLIITKTPPGLATLDGAVVKKPGRKFALQLRQWVTAEPVAHPTPAATEEHVQQLPPSTPEAPPRATNGQHKAGGEGEQDQAVPESGQALLEGLQAFEAKLVAEGRCQPRELLKHVEMMVRGRHRTAGEMADWAPPAIQQAVMEAKAFARQRAAAPAKKQKAG